MDGRLDLGSNETHTLHSQHNTHYAQVAKEVEKHVGLVGRFMDALRHEVKKDMDKFAKK
jgi:hypothetical protein